MIISSNSSRGLRPNRVIATHGLHSRGDVLGHHSLGPIRMHSTVPTASARVLRNVAHTTLKASDFVSTTSFRRAAGILGRTTVGNGISELRNVGRGIVYNRLVPTNANRHRFRGVVINSGRRCSHVLTGHGGMLSCDRMRWFLVRALWGELVSIWRVDLFEFVMGTVKGLCEVVDVLCCCGWVSVFMLRPGGED